MPGRELWRELVGLFAPPPVPGRDWAAVAMVAPVIAAIGAPEAAVSVNDSWPPKPSPPTPPLPPVRELLCLLLGLELARLLDADTAWGVWGSGDCGGDSEVASITAGVLGG